MSTRQMMGVRARGTYWPDYFLNDNEPYEAEPELPADTERTVTRIASDVNIGACSTYWPTMRVTMPRVTMLDGPYRPAAANDNDNRSSNRQQEDRYARQAHEHGVHHAAA